MNYTQKPGLADIEKFLDFSEAKNNICFYLVNRDRNQEWLQFMPHRDFLDLSVAYYYRVESAYPDHAMIRVRNEHIAEWGITEEVLWPLARANCGEMLLPKLVTLKQMMEELQLLDDSDEQYDLVELTKCDAPDMFVLTNQDNFFGASCILYNGINDLFTASFSSNFYVLPSSIHECILLPDSGQLSPNDLKTMVREVNREFVLPEEILSDQVYYYDRLSRKISIC